MPLACPRDAEDAHTAIFVFVVIVFALVFILVIFVVVICGRRAWGPRGHEIDAMFPPPTPPPLDDDDAPPPPGGWQDHAGVDGGSKALDRPPRALGPAWRHRILGILNTIFVVVVSVIVALLLLPSSAVGALSPYSRHASIAAPPDPDQSMPIKLSCLTLCVMMPNHTTNPVTAPHDAPCIVVVAAIIVLPPTAAAAMCSARQVTRQGGRDCAWPRPQKSSIRWKVDCHDTAVVDAMWEE